MNDIKKEKRGFLDNISALLFKGKNEASENSQGNFAESASQLSGALQRLQQTLDKKREEEARSRLGVSSASSTDSSQDSAKMSAKEIEKRDYEAAVSSMKEAVIKRHQEFGTGFSEQTLSDLQDFYEDVVSSISAKELDSRIRASIVQHCFEKTGPYAWQVLEGFMKKANMSWPEPDSLALGDSIEEHKESQEYRLSEAREVFYAQDLKNAVANMGGQVMAWKRYPSQNSWLWKDVELRCVASGIRCQLFHHAIDKLRSESENLKVKAQELIDETMSKIQSVLDTGVKSLEQADQVIQGTDVIVNQVIPELAWEIAKPVVEKYANQFA